MTRSELQDILLKEVHLEIASAARRAIEKLGRAVPEEAVTGYITEADLDELKRVGMTAFDSPAVQKYLKAGIASTAVLSYPPDSVVSATDAAALEGLKLSTSETEVLERIIAEAIHTAFFRFFALLDAVADPEATHVAQWGGARFSTPRKEGPMLHDELGAAYYAYSRKSAVS